MKHAEDKNGGDGVQQSQVSSSEPGPSILANNVIGPLLLEALDGFLFMVSCTGEVEFVSENVTNYLRYLQNDLISKSIYSIIHPDDQLDFSNRLAPLIERSRAAPGNDRSAGRSISFTCRLQVKPNEPTSDSGSVVRPQVPQYETLQILALLQQYPNDREGREGTGGTSQESGNHYFLACIARRLNVMERTPIVHDVAQFLTKQDLKGKILDCDTSRFSTDQLSLSAFIGHNIKDLCHPNDTSQLDRHHNEVLRIGTNLSGVYRMQLAPGHYVFVQTKSKLFKNSANGQSEFIMSTHSIVRKCDKDSELNGSASNSLMKALIGKSLPISISKPREREIMSKSHDQKSQHLTGMFDSSAGGFLPSQCYSNRGSNTVNDLDLDRLSSVGDISDVSDINDLLEILHRQDASSFSCNGGPLNFDILQSNAFDDVAPLMQEVLRQSPVAADRRSVGGSMPRASALMSNSEHVGGGQRFSEVQSGNGNQLSQFNDGELTDDDVTMLLLNLLPAQIQQQQQQQQLQHQQQQQQQHQQQTYHHQTSVNQRQSNSSHFTHQQSTRQHTSSSASLAGTTAGQSRLSLMRRRNHLTATSAQGTAGVNSSLSSFSQGVTSPGLLSPLNTSSPVLSLNMMQSPASANSPWLQSSPVFSDESKPVTLIEQIRRNLKCGNNMSQLNTAAALRTSDTGFGCGTPVGTPQSASKAVGLKDLLLCNDDEDISAKSESQLSRSDSRLSDTPSSGMLTNNQNFLFPSSDGLIENRKRHASACDRPDSSTKSNKPNVLLMKLLSGHDEADNDGDSYAMVTPGTNDANSGSISSKPTSSVDSGERRDEENRRDSATELARSNNLLRQLLNEEKEEGHSPPSPRPLKLLEKLMNCEVSPSGTEKPSSMTQLSPRLLKSPGSDKASTKDKYRPTPEDNDKLKKLTSRWDYSDSTTAVPKTGIKRKASVVLETPADSTDDSIATSSTSVGGERVGGYSRKQPRKDILLTRLLSTTPAGNEPMLDTQAINAIATGTPQMNLVRRSTGEFYTVSGAAINAQSNFKFSNAMSRSASSGSSVGVHGNSLVEKDSRSALASSLLNGDSNLQFLSACDMESDDDLANMLHSITPMEADAAASGEESALLSQLEHILSSPSIALAELDSLLGDGSIDPTSSSSSKTSMMTSMASESCEKTSVVDLMQSHLMKDCRQEPPSTTSDQRTVKQIKKSGTGLLQQLLGGQDDNGARMNQQNSFSQRYCSGQTESMSSTVCNDVSSSRVCSTMVTSSASSSSSTSGISTPADVAALIQRAAAQAASRTSSINNGSQHAIMTDRRDFMSRQNNIRNYIQGDHASSLSPMNNLNDLLNVTIPPNVTAPVIGRNHRMSVAASTSFSTSAPLNVRGGQCMPSVRTTASSIKQRDDFSRQTMNTAIMAGGAIVQNSGIDMMSGQSHGNSLSLSVSSPLFSTDLKSPQSASGNRDLPSPFGSVSHLTTKSTRSGLSSSPAFNGSPHPGCNSYLGQSVGQLSDMKQQDKLGQDRPTMKLMQPGFATDCNRMQMQSGAMSMSRRGSCSLEVMEGLRAKCSARSQSSQQRIMSDPSSYTPNVSTSSETSELPPDILQSLSELTEEHIDCMPSMAEDSLSGRQSASGVNGSLEELLAGLSDDIDEGRGLFAQLNDHQSTMEQIQLKRECSADGPSVPDNSQRQDQRVSATMSLQQMGHCDTNLAVGHGWSQHQSVDTAHLQMNSSNTRSSHQQQFHHQQQQQQQQQQHLHLMQQRFDPPTPGGQQFSIGGMSHVQSIMDNIGSPVMVPSQTPANKLPTVASQYRNQPVSNPQQPMHMGMMNTQHHQPLSHDNTARLMHSQSNSMMNDMTMNSQHHRSASHRLNPNQPQQSAMTSQMITNDCDSRMPATYMRSMSQSIQSSGGGMIQREAMHDHGMHGHRGLGAGAHSTPGQSHKMSTQMPLMHGTEMGMMQKNQSSRMMSGHTGMINNSAGTLQHQQHQSGMMRHQPAMVHSPTTMQQNQFKQMMNQSGMMINQPGSSVNQSRSMTQGQQMMPHNQMGTLQHHQSGLMLQSHSRSGQVIQNHSEMLLNDSAMMKNSSLTQRGQSEIMMNQSRMSNQTSSPAIKSYAGGMPNHLDMMQSNQMGTAQHHMPKHSQQVREMPGAQQMVQDTPDMQMQHHMPKHSQQVREMPGAQQMVQDTPDMQMDMFNWLTSDQGMSADLLAADAQNGQAPIRVSPPKISSGNFQSFSGDHFSTVGQPNGPGIDATMPVGNSSLDFLTNPTSFLSRVHEDGYSSRQQMLQIAMAPDSNDGKGNRQAGNNMYRRQSSVSAAGSTPLGHAGNTNNPAGGSGASMSNGGRFMTGPARDNRDNMGSVGGRGVMSMHASNTRATNDVALDPNLSHLGRRTQQSQQMGNSTVSNVSGSSYLNTTDSIDCGNDSLMSQFFGVTASPLGVVGQNNDTASRSHQLMEATNSQDSEGGALNSALVTGSDERRSLESRHGSNGSLLQQLLSD